MAQLIRIAKKIVLLGHKSHFWGFMPWHKYQEFKVGRFKIRQVVYFAKNLILVVKTTYIILFLQKVSVYFLDVKFTMHRRTKVMNYKVLISIQNRSCLSIKHFLGAKKPRCLQQLVSRRKYRKDYKSIQIDFLALKNNIYICIFQFFFLHMISIELRQ